MKQIITIILLYFSLITSYSQITPIEVTDLTLKVGSLSTEELYYGFAEGDQIVFDFEEVRGKKVKEIEITELPSNSKFMDYNSKKIENKVIHVRKKGVYCFRIKNSAMGKRICKIKIQRVQKSEDLADFNTNWKWKTLYDTSYVPYVQDSLIGYDTLHYKETVKELVKTTQREELIMDKTQRVHSQTNEYGNKTYVYFSLPVNQTSTYKSSKVTAWAFWIGVDESSNEAWRKNAEAIKHLTTGLADIYLTPLGALAMGTITELAIPTIGEDVMYWLTDQQNKDLFMGNYQFNLWDQGKGIAGYKVFKEPYICQGTYYVLLQNDNIMQGIDANVKITAIIETKIYEDKVYNRKKITPQHVQLNKQRMVINTRDVRVNIE